MFKTGIIGCRKLHRSDISPNISQTLMQSWPGIMILTEKEHRNWLKHTGKGV